MRDALAAIIPIRSDHATAPLMESFNWSECMATVPPGRWYLVVFRSVRRRRTDGRRLTRADEAAYQEAMSNSDGLIVYFRGQLDKQRHCVSFCLWTGRDEARRASDMTKHLVAVALADDFYEVFDLERHHLVKHTDGALLLEPAG